ncbi:MAG TPA: hypothetical protein VNO14_06115 [Blastocatellia bacterium]|nr:hypothetical protein [Blastocatellia bacterium]
MSNYPYNQQPPFPGGPPPQSNKGSKILIWSLVGCGALIVIGAIIVIAGGYYLGNKMKELGIEQVKIEGEGDSGTVEIKTREGQVKIGGGSSASLPDWVPQYPGVEVTGSYSVTSDKADSAGFSFTTGDSVEQVVSFYEDGLEGAGLKVTTSLSREGDGVKQGTVVGQDEANKRSASIYAQAEGSGVRVTVTYQVER